nr:hypothetical protein [Angustibacter aerolatus]
MLPTERPDAWEVQGRGEPGPGHPRRADAPRGLRADRRQAAGADPRDRRQGARARRAARRRLAGGVPRRDHPACSPSARAAWSR